jgi:hypothetical protein
VWLWLNRGAIGLPDAHWESLRAAALDNHLHLRALEPDTRCPAPEVLAQAERLWEIAAGLSGTVGVRASGPEVAQQC